MYNAQYPNTVFREQKQEYRGKSRVYSYSASNNKTFLQKKFNTALTTPSTILTHLPGTLKLQSPSQMNDYQTHEKSHLPRFISKFHKRIVLAAYPSSTEKQRHKE